MDCNLEKSFESINQKRLLNLLRRKIQDLEFLELLNKYFHSPIKNLQLGGFRVDRGFGLFQDSELSFVLMNSVRWFKREKMRGF